VLTDAFQQVMSRAASGKLSIETERVPLAKIEDAWERNVQAGRDPVARQKESAAFFQVFCTSAKRARASKKQHLSPAQNQTGNEKRATWQNCHSRLLHSGRIVGNPVMIVLWHLDELSAIR
jgi:hypothetical protein